MAGLDPGRSKCGLVLTDPGRRRLMRAAVLPPEPCLQELRRWLADGCGAVVLGNGTGSGAWRRRLEGLAPAPTVVMVEERGSTLAARRRYWQLFPARGLRRLLPEGLRQPPRDWDDVVAQVLLEEWLGHPLTRDQA